MHKKILAQFHKNLIGSKITDNPFPFAIVDDIFSSNYYSQLLQNLPSLSFFQRLSESEYTNLEKYDSRYTLQLTNQIIESISSLGNPITTLYHSLLTNKFKQYLVEKFVTFDASLKKYDISQLRTDVWLNCDLDGSYLLPHTDTSQKLITIVFYLAENEANLSLGTALYLPKEPGFICKRGKHHSLAKFNLVKIAPYRPNTAFIFFRSNTSFHGMERIESKNIRRYTLLYNLKKPL